MLPPSGPSSVQRLIPAPSVAGCDETSVVRRREVGRPHRLRPRRRWVLPFAAGAVASAAVGRLAAAGVRPERTLVVGDTEHDVRAARAVGASAVAVATGWTEVRELRAAGPDLLLADLADPSQLLEALDGLT